MPLILHHKTGARITATAVNVFPLEAYGLLLGTIAPNQTQAHVQAALPVGKTERWYEPAGRFDRTGEAAQLAWRVFQPWGLAPVGLYCSQWDGGYKDKDGFLASVPCSREMPWLVTKSLPGGDYIWRLCALRLTAKGWRDEELTLDRSTAQIPARNPSRIATAWNRTWGVQDYGNCHETELPRLGLR